MDKNIKDVANRFMLQAICEWGQRREERIQAVQDVLDTVGFKAEAQGWPVFGGIWAKPCTGEEGEEATKWLKSLTDNLERGKIEHEIDQVMFAISAAIDSRT